MSKQLKGMTRDEYWKYMTWNWWVIPYIPAHQEYVYKKQPKSSLKTCKKCSKVYHQTE